MHVNLSIFHIVPYLTQDFSFFSYFKRGQLYGLACFENMPVDNVSERGARMKSVGVLAVSYTSLHYHMNFLKKQVR